jgi:uncharacterized protein YjdB
MSSFVKADGAKITIKFDKPLIGDVTGLSPPLAIDTNIRVSHRVLPKYFGHSYTASNTYLTTNVPSRAFDDSISTFWETRATGTQWIQCELREAQVVKKFRLYSGASNRIRAYNLQASNDTVTWTELWTGENANATAWNEYTFTNTTAYKYYRWEITSRWSTNIYIYELELYADIPVGQERAFTVSGQEVFNVNDELVSGDYKVKSVEVHPTIENAILLNMYELTRFNNVVGNLTVNYNEGLGTLQGNGGIVLGFSQEFAPTDLITKPNQNPLENIEIANVTGTGLLQEVTYLQGYAGEENIEIVDVTATGTLINVEDL